MKGNLEKYIHRFNIDITEIELPEQFNFPFYYEPHRLIELAAEQIQQSHIKPIESIHNFGLDPDMTGLIIGKMFGVLLIKDLNDQIGFLAAFSGKLANSNHIDGFVPTIFDMLDPKGHYKIEEEKISRINDQIELIQSSEKFKNSQKNLSNIQKEMRQDLANLKIDFKQHRKHRRETRQKQKESLSASEYESLHERHKTESIQQQHKIRWAEHNWSIKLKEAQNNLPPEHDELIKLKQLRKSKSNQLQQYLFDQYHFLNQRIESKSLLDIFKERHINQPPAGAGECAAPKLLQFAYQHHLKPLAIGEFWWGASPKSEIRKHGHFYASCKSKCDPILNHMMIGLDVEDNPLTGDDFQGKEIETVFEDDHMMVINKPFDFLSVPGKLITDSVQHRMEQKFPDAKGHIIVHRLDMSTSGLMVIAKTKEAHQKLQRSFIKREVQKTYTALLDGVLESDGGEINLPLRVDLDDRPRQLVCHQHGKPARTIWKKIKSNGSQTLVYFFPVTGRTHQLRMHAAHQDGLNTPIKGDELYGKKSDRLYLHASSLTIQHPITEKRLNFTLMSPFDIEVD